MTVAVHVLDAAKDITGIAVRKGGALKTVTEVWARVGGGLKLVYAKIAIALSTYTAMGRGNSASTIAVGSALVTANITGAVGDIAYVWARTDADPQPWTIVSPNAQSTSFSTICDQGEAFTATFHCTGTDQAGQVITSNDVEVTCANIYYGGGYGGIGPGPYP